MRLVEECGEVSGGVVRLVESVVRLVRCGEVSGGVW